MVVLRSILFARSATSLSPRCSGRSADGDRARARGHLSPASARRILAPLHSAMSDGPGPRELFERRKAADRAWARELVWCGSGDLNPDWIAPTRVESCDEKSGHRMEPDIPRRRWVQGSHGNI